MSVQGLETNTYQDYFTLPGVTFSFSFDVTPLDLTGATARLSIFGIEADGSDFTDTVQLQVLTSGVYPTTYFTYTTAPANTATWQIGAYRYQILVTLADEVTVLPYGHGMVVVRSER